MKNAVFSVIYPQAETYFRDFLDSLSEQTDDTFILFLINNGLSDPDRYLKHYQRPVVMKEKYGSIAAIRKIGIKWIIEEEADVIVFADADDIFRENRIEVSLNKLDDFEIVFNELMLIGKNIKAPIPMLGQYFKEDEKIRPDYLKTRNFMGLSNTAIRTKNLPDEIFMIPDHIIAFDWALFTLCLHSGAKAVFTRQTETYYRQHDNNVTSPLSITEQRIMKGVRVKRDHYLFLSRLYKEYEGLAKVFTDLESQLKDDPSLKKEYCNAARVQSPKPSFWWDNIKSLKELNL